MQKKPVFDARIRYGQAFLGKEETMSPAEALREAEAEEGVLECRELAWLPPQRTVGLVNSRTGGGVWGLYGLLPAVTGEMPKVSELAKGFAEHHIAGFFLRPFEFGIPFDPIFLKAELEACEEREIPIFYRVDGNNPWTYLTAILREHPKLTVVLSVNEEWPNERKLYPLMTEYPNLYICLSEMVWMDCLEDMAEKFGAERLLYSSSWPERYPGGTVMMVESSGLSEEKKELIFRDNLKRLIGGMHCD